ncbi:MAG: hypothetical protein GC199_04750 [Alphaproteobacteria bacterium]|nr:hypothetical protein [Alphaproteobacteria bacterium]
MPLNHIRRTLASWPLFLLFAGIYVVSQIIIAVLVHPLDSARMVELQVTGYSVADYQRAFAIWQEAGVFAFYRAHLIFDDVHWIWYSLALSSGLALGLNMNGAGERWNWIIICPPLAGIQDWFENGLQHVFLSAPGFQAIIDPLPVISTLASTGKWILFLPSLLGVVLLLLAGIFRKRSAKGVSV